MAEIINSNVFATDKKFVDFAGLDYFWEKAKAYVDGVDAEISGKVEGLETTVNGTDEVEGLVKKVADLRAEVNALGGTEGGIQGMIDSTIAGLNLPNTYDAKGSASQALTDAKGYADGLNTAMDDRVKDLEAIDHEKLASDASAAAVATVLDGAPEKFDTLKEIAQWISDSESAATAADLVNRVKALEDIDHDAYIAADEALQANIDTKIGINDPMLNFGFEGITKRVHINTENTKVTGLKSTGEWEVTFEDAHSLYYEARWKVDSHVYDSNGNILLTIPVETYNSETSEYGNGIPCLHRFTSDGNKIYAQAWYLGLTVATVGSIDVVPGEVYSVGFEQGPDLSNLGGSYGAEVIINGPLNTKESIDYLNYKVSTKVSKDSFNSTVNTTVESLQTYTDNTVQKAVDNLKDNEIKANADAIAVLNGTEEGSVAKAVADGVTDANSYADGVAAKALEDANAYTDSKVDGKFDTVGSAAKALEDANAYADSLAGNYDAAGSAATAESNANAYTDGLYNSIQFASTTDIDGLFV